jgi:hypothetical protein
MAQTRRETAQSEIAIFAARRGFRPTIMGEPRVSRTSMRRNILAKNGTWTSPRRLLQKNSFSRKFFQETSDSLRATNRVHGVFENLRLFSLAHLTRSTEVFAIVRNRFAIALAFIAFFQLAGGHWAILQSGAWMGMIVAYSKDGDLSGAMTKTFDGKHPCSLCCAVQDGRKQEGKKAPALQLELKKDFLIRSFLFEVVRDFNWREYLQFDRSLSGIILEPLIPPPRIG